MFENDKDIKDLIPAAQKRRLSGSFPFTVMRESHDMRLNGLLRGSEDACWTSAVC